MLSAVAKDAYDGHCLACIQVIVVVSVTRICVLDFGQEQVQTTAAGQTPSIDS